MIPPRSCDVVAGRRVRETARLAGAADAAVACTCGASAAGCRCTSGCTAGCSISSPNARTQARRSRGRARRIDRVAITPRSYLVRRAASKRGTTIRREVFTETVRALGANGLRRIAATIDVARRPRSAARAPSSIPIVTSSVSSIWIITTSTMSPDRADFVDCRAVFQSYRRRTAHREPVRMWGPEAGADEVARTSIFAIISARDAVAAPTAARERDATSRATRTRHREMTVAC